MIAPQLSAALEDWLAQGRARRGYAEKTIEAYRADVAGFLGFLARHNAGAEGVASIERLAITDLRAFMAHERARGTSARSLCRRLSAVRGVVGWLRELEWLDATTPLSIRDPRGKPRLPRPLAPQAARDMIDAVEVEPAEP